MSIRAADSASRTDVAAVITPAPAGRGMMRRA